MCGFMWSIIRTRSEVTEIGKSTTEFNRIASNNSHGVFFLISHIHIRDFDVVQHSQRVTVNSEICISICVQRDISSEIEIEHSNQEWMWIVLSSSLCIALKSMPDHEFSHCITLCNLSCIRMKWIAYSNKIPIGSDNISIQQKSYTKKKNNSIEFIEWEKERIAVTQDQSQITPASSQNR